MASRKKKTQQFPAIGLRRAREAAGMTQPQAADAASKITPISLKHYKFIELGKNKLSKEWANIFARVFDTTAQRIMFPDVDDAPHIESSDVGVETEGDEARLKRLMVGGPTIRELDVRAGLGGGGVPSQEIVRDGRHGDAMKSETWHLPASYLREIGVLPSYLLVLECGGDSMFPTIASGERVLADTRHRQPSPDGIYALRDMFGTIIVKRLQMIRGKPPRVKIISDNPSHLPEEVSIEDIEIVGKVVIGFKRF